MYLHVCAGFNDYVPVTRGNKDSVSTLPHVAACATLLQTPRAVATSTAWVPVAWPSFLQRLVSAAQAQQASSLPPATLPASDGDSMQTLGGEENVRIDGGDSL